MIKAVCDKCGKEIVLKFSDKGLESLPDWDMETHFNPSTREFYYKTFCQECNPKSVGKVEKKEE